MDTGLLSWCSSSCFTASVNGSFVNRVGYGDVCMDKWRHQGRMGLGIVRISIITILLGECLVFLSYLPPLSLPHSRSLSTFLVLPLPPCLSLSFFSSLIIINSSSCAGRHQHNFAVCDSILACLLELLTDANYKRTARTATKFATICLHPSVTQEEY